MSVPADLAAQRPPIRRLFLPMVVDPMLATSGPLPEDEERWSFEPKWDGSPGLSNL